MGNYLNLLRLTKRDSVQTEIKFLCHLSRLTPDLKRLKYKNIDSI